MGMWILVIISHICTASLNLLVSEHGTEASGQWSTLTQSWLGAVSTTCICPTDDGRSAPCSACQFWNWFLWAGSKGTGSVPFPLKYSALITSISYIFIQFCLISGKNLVTATLPWLETEVWNKSFKLIFKLWEKMDLSWMEIRSQYPTLLTGNQM